MNTTLRSLYEYWEKCKLLEPIDRTPSDIAAAFSASNPYGAVFVPFGSMYPDDVFDVQKLKYIVIQDKLHIGLKYLCLGIPVFHVDRGFIFPSMNVYTVDELNYITRCYPFDHIRKNIDDYFERNLTYFQLGV